MLQRKRDSPWPTELYNGVTQRPMTVLRTKVSSIFEASSGLKTILFVVERKLTKKVSNCQDFRHVTPAWDRGTFALISCPLICAHLQVARGEANRLRPTKRLPMQWMQLRTISERARLGNQWFVTNKIERSCNCVFCGGWATGFVVYPLTVHLTFGAKQ